MQFSEFGCDRARLASSRMRCTLKNYEYKHTNPSANEGARCGSSAGNMLESRSCVTYATATSSSTSMVAGIYWQLVLECTFSLQTDFCSKLKVRPLQGLV